MLSLHVLVISGKVVFMTSPFTKARKKIKKGEVSQMSEKLETNFDVGRREGRHLIEGNHNVMAPTFWNHKITYANKSDK